jgi:hypothetical protein
MTSQQLDTLERRAYQEAGHTVMSYLIRQGFTNKFVPIDRSLILPEFERVAIEGQSADWAKTTFGLGSLITASQVLLAGYAAERIKYNIREDSLPRNSASVKRAEHLTAAYIEEYAGDGLSASKRDRRAAQLVREMFDFVEKTLRTYWVSVEALANALLQRKSLTEAEAFEVIEKDIPEDAKVRAEARIQKWKRRVGRA